MNDISTPRSDKAWRLDAESKRGSIVNDDQRYRASCLLEREVVVLKLALREIERFGHGNGYWRGFSCANKADEALATVERMRREA